MWTGRVAAPGLSSNVRFIRKVQEDRGEAEENRVEILEDEERHTDPGSDKARPHTQQSPSVAQRRCFKAEAALGVMYLLLLAGIFTRYVLVCVERDQLQTRYDNLSNNYRQFLAESCGMTVLAINNSQLQNEVKKLKSDNAVNCCPEGWQRFGRSCYFQSTERRDWSDSRKTCQDRKADLVIIKSKEEQDFVIGLNNNGGFWIGIRRVWNGRRFKWEWVDGSQLTETSWTTEQLKDLTNLYNGVFCDQDGKWTQRRRDDKLNWICEKNISCFH